MGSPASGSPWLLPLSQPAETRVRLVCFPYAGGGVAPYREWARSLPYGVELCGVQLPGRENRMSERPRSDLTLVLADVADALTALVTQPPMVFFGHSLGGLIGYETSRILQAAGLRQPAHLVVSGCRAAHLADPDPPIGSLPDADFRAELRRLGGTAEEILADTEVLRVLMPMLRADFTLVDSYRHRPGPPLECPITALAGTADPKVAVHQARAWEQHTAAQFRLLRFPGGHFFPLSHRAQVVAAVSEVVGAVVARSYGA